MRLLALAQQRDLSLSSGSCAPAHTSTLTLAGLQAEDIDQGMQDGIKQLWSLMLGESAPSLEAVPLPAVSVEASTDASSKAAVEVSYAAAELGGPSAADLAAYTSNLLQDVASGSLQGVLRTDVGLPSAAQLVLLEVRVATC